MHAITIEINRGHPCRPARGGWSLIDLLVLLLVLFLVAGLTVPFVKRQHKSAERVHCTYNLQQLGNALNKYNEVHGFLPPARIADDYATWAVLVAPYLEKRPTDALNHPLENWDTGRRYADQPQAVREAWLRQMFCPSRQRGGPLSTQGDGEPGAVGDYACVSGDGRADHPWKGPRANGPMILGEVVKEDKGVIASWRGRTQLDQTSLRRGLSVTLLLGEKHVPYEAWGNAAEGDGSIYNGGHPACTPASAARGSAWPRNPPPLCRQLWRLPHRRLPVPPGRPGGPPRRHPYQRRYPRPADGAQRE